MIGLEFVQRLYFINPMHSHASGSRPSILLNLFCAVMNTRVNTASSGNNVVMYAWNLDMKGIIYVLQICIICKTFSLLHDFIHIFHMHSIARSAKLLTYYQTPNARLTTPGYTSHKLFCKCHYYSTLLLILRCWTHCNGQILLQESRQNTNAREVAVQNCSSKMSTA